MNGNGLSLLPNSTDEHTPPPRPSTPCGRRLSIRELVDRELRSALLHGVADLKRRPSESYDNVARGHTRPAGHFPERLIEHAEHGGSRERMKAAVRAAAERIVDLVHDAVADAQRDSRKAA